MWSSYMNTVAASKAYFGSEDWRYKLGEVLVMKELCEGDGSNAARSLQGGHLPTTKLLHDPELEHLVSSSVPSPPIAHYGALPLLNPNAISMFGADPSAAVFSAHLLASIAASNPNTRFQLPLALPLAVSGASNANPHQLFHHPSNVPSVTSPMNHYHLHHPSGGNPNLELLSSWVSKKTVPDDKKGATISKSYVNNNNNHNGGNAGLSGGGDGGSVGHANTNKNGTACVNKMKKSRGSNWSNVDDFHGQKNGSGKRGNKGAVLDQIPYENHVDLKKEKVEPPSEINIQSMIIPSVNNGQDKITRKKRQRKETVPCGNNNNKQASNYSSRSNKNLRNKAGGVPSKSNLNGDDGMIDHPRKTKLGQLLIKEENEEKKEEDDEVSQEKRNGTSSVQQQQSVHSTTRDKVFTCSICNRCFGYKHVLQNHERTHTGEKPFHCLICEKKFTRDHHLKTHMRLHTGEKPYHCSHCDRQFVQVANLRRHLRVHTGEKPYACELCPYRFSDSNQLKAHTLIHKGEKPHGCGDCGSRFRRRHHMMLHKCKDKTVSPEMSLSSSPSPTYISPTNTMLKRGRKARETRRIIRLEDVSNVASKNELSYMAPLVPEQTQPEDLSIHGALNHAPFLHCQSRSSASPSPPSGTSNLSFPLSSHSTASSDPPELLSDEERQQYHPDTTNLHH